MTWRPGRRFRVGKMRERITVQTQSDTRDAAGQAVTTSWPARLTNEPASVEFTGGGQTYRGQQLQEDIEAVFVVRYRDGYDPTQRIVHDGETYGITRVSKVDGGRRYLELFCRGVVA